MIAIITRKIPFFKRQEIWFYDDSEISLKGNNLFIHALAVPKNITITNIHKVYTTSIDLLQTLEEIKSNLKTKLRGYINKGEKNNFEHQVLDISQKTIQNSILEQYNIFATQKNIALLDKQVFAAYCKSGKMIATQIRHNNQPLITHVYLHNNDRTSLLYSYHLLQLDNYDGQFRSLANRYLHWLDIIYFKDNYFKTYDLGGISSDSNSLRDFKISFGGIIEEQYGFMVQQGLIRVISKFKAALTR